MSERNIFKEATRKKYRWNFRGVCTVEDLWDLDVTHLDSIYKALKKQQKDADGESLLTTASKEDVVLEDKIAIVKAIVTDKLAAIEAAKNAAKKRRENQRILEIIADKQDAALKEKSLEELQAMLTAEED